MGEDDDVNLKPDTDRDANADPGAKTITIPEALSTLLDTFKSSTGRVRKAMDDVIEKMKDRLKEEDGLTTAVEEEGDKIKVYSKCADLAAGIADEDRIGEDKKLTEQERIDALLAQNRHKLAKDLAPEIHKQLTAIKPLFEPTPQEKAADEKKTIAERRTADKMLLEFIDAHQMALVKKYSTRLRHGESKVWYLPAFYKGPVDEKGFVTGLKSVAFGVVTPRGKSTFFSPVVATGNTANPLDIMLLHSVKEVIQESKTEQGKAIAKHSKLSSIGEPPSPSKPK